MATEETNLNLLVKVGEKGDPHKMWSMTKETYINRNDDKDDLYINETGD